MMEQTLVLIKPDALARGLAGEIIGRFERVGLKIVAAKMLRADADLINQHYPTSRQEFIIGMGEKVLANSEKMGIDTQAAFGTSDPHELGLKIQQYNVDYLQKGPVWALVLAGPSAIAIVRKLRGNTLPSDAPPGTINGDFSFDSSHFANSRKRSLYNLVHASGNAEEAVFEINLWFKPQEIYNYKAIHQSHMID